MHFTSPDARSVHYPSIPRLASLLILSFTYSVTATTLDFDDLPTPHGTSTLPQPYSNLTFTGFTAFAPRHPSLANLITPEDHNCAVSAPNAILGSRIGDDGGVIASFGVREGMEMGFELEGMMMKPLNAPEPGTKMFVKGVGNWSESESGIKEENVGEGIGERSFGLQMALQKGEERQDDGSVLETRTWEVFFPMGFHEMLHVRMRDFTGLRWRRLVRVDVWADFGYDSLDWEFCIDDLAVVFGGEAGDSAGRAEHDTIKAKEKGKGATVFPSQQHGWQESQAYLDGN